MNNQNKNYFKGNYHWKDKKKLDIDSQFLEVLYENNLISISDKLNKFHNLNKSKRYWRIVVGPWLRFFIDIVYDRYETERINNPHFRKINNLNYEKIFFREKDFDDFYSKSITDEWNTNLIKIISGRKPNYRNSLISKKNSLFRITLINIINFFRSLFNKKILISDIYISKLNLLKLFINTGFIPYFPQEIKILKDNNWYKFLDIENINLSKNNKSHFINLIEKLIEIYIPYIYTDGFKNYRKFAIKSIGQIPKTAFTCIGYQHNEVFKLISAEAVENGGKLIISQHGGNFGIAKHNQMEKHQIKISDKFLTWGWDNNTENTIPFFSLQLSSNKLPIYKNSKNPKIINIMASSPRYFYSFFSLALGPEYKDYLKKQKDLADKLKPNITQNIFHRFNGNTFGWSARNELEKYGLKICNSSNNLNKEIKKYSLCISSYNATVALQTLSANFPTILYWPKEIFEIRNECLKDFNELASVDIYHDNIISLSEHLNKIYNNIDLWWEDNLTQKKGILFIEKYAKNKINWIKEVESEIKF